MLHIVLHRAPNTETLVAQDKSTDFHLVSTTHTILSYLLPQSFVPTHLQQRVLRYLGEAAGGAVLAPRREVPQLGVQQLHQLGHGSNRGRHVTGTQEAFGLVRQLLGHDRRRLPRPELREGG